MPFYYFKCTECDNIQEELVKHDTKETICKKCIAPTSLDLKYSFSSPGLLKDKNEPLS